MIFLVTVVTATASTVAIVSASTSATITVVTAATAAKVFLFVSTTAAAFTFFAGSRFIHNNFATQYIGIVQIADSSACSIVIAHFNKAKTFAAVVVEFVGNNFCRYHFTIGRE